MGFYSAFEKVFPDEYQYDHQVICYSEQSGRYQALNPETAHERIRFNKIIDLAREHLSTATEAELTVLENGIRCMADRKIEKTHFDQGFCGIIRAFFARLHNLFSGYGFTTSVDRANYLIDEIKAYQAGAPLDQRPFKHAGTGDKARIDWSEGTLKGWCVRQYEKSYHVKLDPQRIHVVGKQTPFTYYNERPENVAKEREEIVSKFSSDAGWGCAWRGALNVIEKGRQWLAEKGIATDPAKQEDRFIDMGDVAELSQFPAGEWMEPIDGAELFYKFVQNRYSEEDQKKIYALLQPKGHLYSAGDRLTTLREILTRQISHGGKTKDHEVMPLDTLRAVYWEDALEDSLKQVMELAADPNAPLDSISGKHANSIKDAVAILRNTKLDLGTYTLEKYCKVAMALVKFYPPETFHANEGVTAAQCPALDEIQQPFPWMIDDKYTARNIYAYCTNDKDVVTHVFLGETHVGYMHLGPHDNPWLDCSWKPIDRIFKATNQLMLFELSKQA